MNLEVFTIYKLLLHYNHIEIGSLNYYEQDKGNGSLDNGIVTKCTHSVYEDIVEKSNKSFIGFSE